MPTANLNDTKFPLYQGEFIANDIDNQGYHIFAAVKLHKDKLVVDVNSKQRANIAQDAMATELGDMISNPKIVFQS